MPVAREEFTTKVRSAAYERAGGRCEQVDASSFRCEAILGPGNVHYDHRIPWAISRDSSLANCDALCRAHHVIKTAETDIPLIAKGKRVAAKHVGAKAPSAQPVPSRATPPKPEPRPPARGLSEIARRFVAVEDA